MSEVVAIRCIDLRQIGLIGEAERRKMAPVEPRRRLKEIAAAGGRSLAELSRAIGRNPAYLQQFVERGSPKRLPEDDRRHLAIYLGIDERELGARDPWTPAR